MRCGVPLEHEPAVLQVVLEHRRVEQCAVGGAADRAEVGGDVPVRGDQRGPVLKDRELVLAEDPPAVRGDRLDDVVVAVGDEVLALRVLALRERDRSLPPGEHRLAAVGLHLQVERVEVRGHRPEPHDLAAVVEDQRPRLPDELLALLDLEQVGEAAEEIGRTAVHELDQIRKPLIEVASAQPEDVGPKVGRKRNLRRTDLLGTEIGTSRREECRSQLVEGWRVESSAERSPDP